MKKLLFSVSILASISANAGFLGFPNPEDYDFDQYGVSQTSQKEEVEEDKGPKIGDLIENEDKRYALSSVFSEHLMPYLSNKDINNLLSNKFMASLVSSYRSSDKLFGNPDLARKYLAFYGWMNADIYYNLLHSDYVNGAPSEDARAHYFQTIFKKPELTKIKYPREFLRGLLWDYDFKGSGNYGDDIPKYYNEFKSLWNMVCQDNPNMDEKQRRLGILKQLYSDFEANFFGFGTLAPQILDIGQFNLITNTCDKRKFISEFLDKFPFIEKFNITVNGNSVEILDEFFKKQPKNLTLTIDNVSQYLEKLKSKLVGLSDLTSIEGLSITVTQDGLTQPLPDSNPLPYALGDLLARSETIKALNIHSLPMNYDSFDHLMRMVEISTSLERLSFDYIDLNFEKMTSLARIIKNQNCIKTLSIGNCKLVELDVKTLTDAINDSKVKSLSFHSCDIYCSAIRHISNMLISNSQLTSLDLSHNALDVVGEQYLIEALSKNSTITSINFNGTIIGDSLVELLEKNTSITEVQFGKLTVVGVSNLQDLLGKYNHFRNVKATTLANVPCEVNMRLLQTLDSYNKGSRN